MLPALRRDIAETRRWKAALKSLNQLRALGVVRRCLQGRWTCLKGYEVMRAAFAHAVSIVGHPALLVPVAVGLKTGASELSATSTITVTGVSAVIALSALIYGLLQVRAGQWQHPDASMQKERLQLNVFLAFSLLSASIVLWSVRLPWQLALGLAIAGAIIVVALALRNLHKISLHSAFAVFSAFVLWPNIAGVSMLLLLATLIAWSRLVLRRHTGMEVFLGLLVGVLAGGCLAVATA